MPHVTCSTPEFKWGMNNKRHYRLLAVPIIRHFEHHIVQKAYLTFGTKGFMFFFEYLCFIKSDSYLTILMPNFSSKYIRLAVTLKQFPFGNKVTSVKKKLTDICGQQKILNRSRSK